MRAARCSSASFPRRVRVVDTHTPSLTGTGSGSPLTMTSSRHARGARLSGPSRWSPWASACPPRSKAPTLLLVAAGFAPGMGGHRRARGVRGRSRCSGSRFSQMPCSRCRLIQAPMSRPWTVTPGRTSVSPCSLAREFEGGGVVALPVEGPWRVPVGVDRLVERGTPPSRPFPVLAQPAGLAEVGEPLADGHLLERGVLRSGGRLRQSIGRHDRCLGPLGGGCRPVRTRLQNGTEQFGTATRALSGPVGHRYRYRYQRQGNAYGVRALTPTSNPRSCSH